MANTYTPAPTSTRTRHSRTESLTVGGIQLDGLGEHIHFRLSCGRKYQPKARTVPRGGSAPRGHSRDQARYLHHELRLLPLDIAVTIGVRLEQVKDWLSE